MTGLYIHGASAFIIEPLADMDLLKQEMRKYTRDHFRRTNRFILLSLIGARQCIHYRRSVPADTAVYLTTEHGNLADTVAALDEIHAGHTLPKPFHFINTMSNTAAFHLSQHLGIRGRNLTLSSQCLSFERGIDLVMDDFSAGTECSALIGGVDAAGLSADHAEYSGGCGRRTVDGSGWFYVRPEPEGSIGIFHESRLFRDGAACLKWIREGRRSSVDMIAFGTSIGRDEADRWRDLLAPVDEFGYLDRHGYCGSAAACGIGLFVKVFPGRSLLHINRNRRGHHAILEVEVF